MGPAQATCRNQCEGEIHSEGFVGAPSRDSNQGRTVSMEPSTAKVKFDRRESFYRQTLGPKEKVVAGAVHRGVITVRVPGLCSSLTASILP